MDHSTTFLQQYGITVLYVAGILSYGIHQYVKREKAHKALVQSILAGEGAIDDSANRKTGPALWRLLSITAMELLLLGAISWTLFMQPKILFGGGVMYILAVFFLLLFALLMPLLVQEIKRYRSSKAF